MAQDTVDRDQAGHSFWVFVLIFFSTVGWGSPDANRINGVSMGGKLVTVASFGTAVEAHLARSALESLGIFVAVFDEQTVNIDWMYSNAVGGVKVKVREENLSEARKILEGDSREKGGEGPEAGTPEVCPRCEGTDVEYSMDRRGPMLTWLFLGFPILPVRKRLRCRSCGKAWKPRRTG